VQHSVAIGGAADMTSTSSNIESDSNRPWGVNPFLRLAGRTALWRTIGLCRF
jgi:hypothetical protein